MAVDIGPRIGIDGEKAFRDSINAINGEIKKFSAEMKALSLEMDNTDDKEGVLARQNEVLRQSISSTQKSLDVMTKEAEKQADALRKLGEELDKATNEYGENSDEAVRAQNAYNKQYKELTKLQTNIAKTTGDMNKLQSELRQNENAMNGLDGETGKLADSFDDAGESAAGFGDILSANLISDAITGAISGIVSGLKQVSEESREFRKIMGSLEISSEKAGYSAAETEAAYNSLYGVLADNQTAATTTANLQALGLEQEQLNQLINGTIGAWATYGDSIPIDGLAEAINETAQVGTVTGTFADVLNWAGTSEDEFNEKLANCSTESERANLILQELANQGLIAAGEGWQQNNASLVEANQATADYEAAMAQLGETVEPVFTRVQEAVTQVVQKLTEFAQWAMENGPIVESVIAGIGAGFIVWNVASIIQGVTTAISAFKATNEGATVAQWALNAAMNANPIGILVTVIAAVVTALVTFIATNEDARTKLVEVWNTIKTTVSGAIENVKQILNSIIEFVKNNWQSLLTMLVNPFVGAFKLLYDNCEGFREIVDNMVSRIKESFQNLVSSVSQKAQEIGNTIKNGVQGAVDYIASLPSKFLQWGRDMIDNLVQGIKNGIGKIKDAIGSIADTIRSYIHFSEPDVGPLSDFSSYMPDMTSQIAEGIREGIPNIKAAMNEMAENMLPKQANGTALAYDRMAAQLSGLQVVLDDGTLVGKLSPKINNALGGYARREGRFGT